LWQKLSVLCCGGIVVLFPIEAAFFTGKSALHLDPDHEALSSVTR
jgi:hypothetical protein